MVPILHPHLTKVDLLQGYGGWIIRRLDDTAHVLYSATFLAVSVQKVLAHYAFVLREPSCPYHSFHTPQIR